MEACKCGPIHNMRDPWQTAIELPTKASTATANHKRGCHPRSHGHGRGPSKRKEEAVDTATAKEETTTEQSRGAGKRERVVDTGTAKENTTAS